MEPLFFLWNTKVSKAVLQNLGMGWDYYGMGIFRWLDEFGPFILGRGAPMISKRWFFLSRKARFFLHQTPSII